eukprot:scaffold93554_cov55-Phaeocystis_antarctica.AAC.3
MRRRACARGRVRARAWARAWGHVWTRVGTHTERWRVGRGGGYACVLGAAHQSPALRCAYSRRYSLGCGGGRRLLPSAPSHPPTHLRRAELASLCICITYSPPRTLTRWFNNCVLTAILANCICMAAEDPLRRDPNQARYLVITP